METGPDLAGRVLSSLERINKERQRDRGIYHGLCVLRDLFIKN